MPCKNFLTNHQLDIDCGTELLCAWCWQPGPSRRVYRKRADTVGELRSAVLCVLYMPSLKAKKLEKLTREKTVLER
jgi:hypothetical protein